MLFINLNSQQWVDDSCNKKASEIVNEAVEHLANLEQLMAVGMAKAALMLDDDCGCANLVMAAAAARTGSRKSKLEAIDVNGLTSEEKVWHKMLTATLTGDADTYRSSISDGLKETPDSPLLNWFNAGGDYNNYAKFAQDFPEHASAAYNMVAYGYANGEIGGKVDYDAAFKAIDKSRELHDGPNALDSKAEIAAAIGTDINDTPIPAAAPNLCPKRVIRDKSEKDKHALPKYSLKQDVNVNGRPKPPYSTFPEIPSQPPSANILYAFANPSSVRTTPFSSFAGFLSDLWFSGATSSSAIFAISLRT